MDDPDDLQSLSPKNLLPDVVHSRQTPNETPSINLVQDTGEKPVSESDAKNNRNTSEVSETESISEHISHNIDFSLSDVDNETHESHKLLDEDKKQENISNSLHPSSSQTGDNVPNVQETSARSPSISDLRDESPIQLPLSSDASKEGGSHESKSQTHLQSSVFSENAASDNGSPRSKYSDSLNDEVSDGSGEDKKAQDDSLSGSEEIIKLDIRGQGGPRFPLLSSKIIFGMPPEGSSIIDPIMEPMPSFETLLSPFLVTAEGNMKIEEVFEKTEDSDPKHSKLEQSDLLVEEIVVEDCKEQEDNQNDEEQASLKTQPKSFAPEETMSFSTLTTDYKTICEEYNTKLVHLEGAILQRNLLIEELTVSLQRTQQERDELKSDNEHLRTEVIELQHVDRSDQDTVKAQLSDFMKYESMLRDDTTQFYSAVMSSGSSQSSKGEQKDNVHEEITVNYSRSDLKSSGSSNDSKNDFETKLTEAIQQFDEYIEENARNKLREKLSEILVNEISRLRIENDTEVKEMECQMLQDKQAYSSETRRLQELLANVKSGNVNIDELREELNTKHNKEMENLRTYFEKQCSDIERSYSEDVWRERAAASPCSLDSTRRTRSADLPATANYTQITQVETCAKLIRQKYEQQIEDMRCEQITCLEELRIRHRETVAALEAELSQLKAHPDHAPDVSLYQQDIDLELEKSDRVTQQVIHHLQEQIQVLLSDPDAELTSWPLDLVALRDKLYTDVANRGTQEVSGQNEELSGAGDADKWRQRRNLSFDQNRQLEEITKERDELRLVAVGLQRTVCQLLAYCSAAEDELNRTVLSELLARLHQDSALEEDSQFGLSGEVCVHLAPELGALGAELEAAGVGAWLERQRDLARDVQRDLDLALARLRGEAHRLLQLAGGGDRTAPMKMLDCSEVRISELVDEIEMRQKNCENCELHQKCLEEALSECQQRETVLRAELEAAMMKIAHFVTHDDLRDVIAEGYGTGVRAPLSLPARRPPSSPPSPLSPSPGSPCPSPSPRRDLARLHRDLDALHKERDDLHLQLESANRQLRATRQFMEEQAAEREAERDEGGRQLREVREDHARLARRLHANARILTEMCTLKRQECHCGDQRACVVEQLEAQTKDMNQLIAELESKKATADGELKASSEKISLLRDVISNLEQQLEQKGAREAQVLEELGVMRASIEERDARMRSLLLELEEARCGRGEGDTVACDHGDGDGGGGGDGDEGRRLMETVQEQSGYLEQWVRRRSARLERVHEVCSASCSEPSEDVSIRDQRQAAAGDAGVGESLGEVMGEAVGEMGPSPEWVGGLSRVWERLAAHARAEDAAVKRVRDLEMQRAQLNAIAQEVRAERDVLQQRMSEQALKLSSLSARLEQQRSAADAQCHHATSHLSVQLHDANAEVQRLKEELDSKEKQLLRLKQSVEERDKLSDQRETLYGNSCNPKDKVIILERELSSAQTRIAQLETLNKSLEADKAAFQQMAKEKERLLAEKETQLHELLELKLEDDLQKTDQKSEIADGKTSARTLSDIVSISDYDEQDLQMRRAEMKLNQSLNPPYPDHRDRTINKTLPPDINEIHHMSSLVDYTTDPLDIAHLTPRANSFPISLTSTQNKNMLINFKRNVNETTAFGTVDKFGDSVKHSTAQNIPDNTSLYPNRDVSDDKNATVEPKRINFSLEPSYVDNRLQDQEDFPSLKELGIIFDNTQENLPNILSKLKNEIKKSRSELDTSKSQLKQAEEQLCDLPALKEQVEELKTVLENTVATMQNDKIFYENQLENFTSNKKLLEQRVAELTQDVNEKSNDLHLLKEDILRRENMILELAKEKRNLTNKMTELEVKIDELQSRNDALSKYEIESKVMKDKINDLQKVEQLVSEKNQQIDSLNQHLDRLDDLQRCLNDKTEEFDNLKEAFEEKSNELFQLQDTIEALNKDISNANDENAKLIINNKDLKQKLTKLEKEQENASLKLQSNETEVVRLNTINNELLSKLEDMKMLTDKLKDKQYEIEILNEDINSFHEEIATLREQLKMVSRSPSPRTNKIDEEKLKAGGRVSDDKKQLVKIRKQISLLQHELDFHKKELNNKAFELAKAKLDVTELRTNLSQAAKEVADRELAVAELVREREGLVQEREGLGRQLRESGERCRGLELEVEALKGVLTRVRVDEEEGEAREEGEEEEEGSRALVVSGARSPTAELEQAVRAQLDYSHRLDDDMMQQILSSSSDVEDVPRLALNISKSSSSLHSSSSEKISRLRSDNEKLRMQVDNLDARLHDKDALIVELNRVREQLSSECQSARLRLEAERENAGRLQLLLETHKETAESLQNQDTNMIGILKKRLESAMQSELELQQDVQLGKARVHHLETRLLQLGAGLSHPPSPSAQEGDETRLHTLRLSLQQERDRGRELAAMLEAVRAEGRREADLQAHRVVDLTHRLAEVKREKQEAVAELSRVRDLLAVSKRRDNIAHSLSEFECHKAELSRDMATLRKCLEEGSASSQRLRREVVPPVGEDDREQAMRYLHARCVRLASCRKALVWQKRYLMQELAGYAKLERALAPAAAETSKHPRTRFRCAVLCVMVVCRMGYIVRRRQAARAVSVCLLRPTLATPTHTPNAGVTQAHSPPSREVSGTTPASLLHTPRTRHPLHRDYHIDTSPTVEMLRRATPRAHLAANTDAFVISVGGVGAAGGGSSTGVAAGYLTQLDNVQRALHRTLHN